MDNTLRLLIVEDNDADYQLMVRYLQRAGFHFDLLRATSREEYLVHLAQAPLDLILADYALPSFDGLEALALAQERCPDVPFIFVSGVLGEERAVETLKAGAVDYVLKDRPARLGSAVKRALKEADEVRKRREAEEWVRRRTIELEAANAELAAHRTQLQMLSRRLVEVQEAERQALSRDLHDTASQALTAIAMGLGRLARQRDQSEPVQEQITALRELTDQVVGDLRRLAVNLRPAALDRYGLVAGVEQYIEALRKRDDLTLELKVEGLEDERLPAEIETALYRIIQEALANVIRHAHASAATVQLRRRNGEVIAVITDDGVGCDVRQALQSGRLGLMGMRERAEMLRGALELESAPGAGVRVTVRMPVE